MRSLVRAAWGRWKRIAHAIGTFQARLILALLYAILLPPFALIARRGRDPLQLRAGTTPRWHDRTLPAPGLEQGRRQFS